MERISNRTREEEQELQNKRDELFRLETRIDEQKQPNNPEFPWTKLGIMGIVLIMNMSIVTYLLVKEFKEFINNKNRKT